MIKLPSFQYLLANAGRSFRRFPLTVICSFIAVSMGIYLIEFHEELQNLFPFINTMLCLGLGIPLYFCASIVSEKKKLEKSQRGFLLLAVTVVLVLLYLTLPGADSTHNTTVPYIRYGLYNVTAHLLVSVVPFAFAKQLNGFWNYNKALFLRILLSVLYSGFIYVGLILALTALRLLFEVAIPDELYFEILVVTIGFFNTWFFVSGIPDDFDRLDAVQDYPKGLRIFTQYVLLPLLALYLLILYSYGAKILIGWDWPKGIVAYLITFVSIGGILTFLLMYPYGNQKEYSWIKATSKGYYFVLIPLLVLLYIAILMRIDDYGITINRYAVLLLAIWVSLVCLYTVLGKTNIKFIPISLAATLVLCSFGPWGLFSVSERSQVNRLRNILEKEKILVNGQIQNEPIWVKDSLPRLYSKNENGNEAILNDSLHNEVKSILEYLDNHHGYASIRSWYRQDINSIVDLQQSGKRKSSAYILGESELYMRSMGLKSDWRYKTDSSPRLSFRVSESDPAIPISGYNYMIEVERYFSGSKDGKIATFECNGVSYELRCEPNNHFNWSLKSKNSILHLELRPLLKNLQDQYGQESQFGLPASAMTVVAADEHVEIKLELTALELESKKSGISLSNIKGHLLIKNK